MIGLWKVRQIERKHTDDNRDNLGRINGLETRVWDGLNKSQTILRETIQKQLDELRAEVRGQIEQRQRDLDRDFSKRIVALERKAGSRPPDQRVFRTHDGHEFSWEYLAGLPDAQRADAFEKYKGLSEWYDRETSDRMGPPGRIGEPWSNPEIVERSDTEQIVKHQRRARETYSVVNRDGTPQVWSHPQLDALPVEQRKKLFSLHPDLGEWYSS